LIPQQAEGYFIVDMAILGSYDSVEEEVRRL
jgi:hypothetical protein